MPPVGMVRLANARAQVSAAAAATIQLAAPLIAVAANEVPFGGTVVFLIGCIANHLAAVKGNDGLARKAERLTPTVILSFDVSLFCSCLPCRSCLLSEGLVHRPERHKRKTQS